MIIMCVYQKLLNQVVTLVFIKSEFFDGTRSHLLCLCDVDLPQRPFCTSLCWGVNSQVGECLVGLCHQWWRPFAEEHPRALREVERLTRNPEKLANADGCWKDTLGWKRSFKTHRPPYPTMEDWSPPGKRPRNSYMTNLDGQCQGGPEGETYPKTTGTGKATKKNQKKKSGGVLWEPHRRRSRRKRRNKKKTFGIHSIWRYGYCQEAPLCSISYSNLYYIAVVRLRAPSSESLEEALYTFSKWINACYACTIARVYNVDPIYLYVCMHATPPVRLCPCKAQK